MKGQKRIEAMFAFILLNDDGTEGMPAFDAGGYAMPLVGADLKRVASLRPIAQNLARRSGKRITLVKFIKREELEVITWTETHSPAPKTN